MEHEATTRLAFFFGILVLVALGELLSPRRALTMSRPIRWFSNLGVVAVGALAVRLLFPFRLVKRGVDTCNKSHGFFSSKYYVFQ